MPNLDHLQSEARKEFEGKFLKDDLSGEKASLDIPAGQLSFIAKLEDFLSTHLSLAYSAGRESKGKEVLEVVGLKMEYMDSDYSSAENVNTYRNGINDEKSRVRTALKGLIEKK